jgi:hypothetical protein
VVLCGILERSNWDVAGALAGQRNDLKTTILPAEIEHIKLSETCHVVYQALCRGACRIVRDGKASPMKAWLFHRDPTALKGALTESRAAVMPHAQWHPWNTEYVQADPQKIATAAAALCTCLEALPSTLNEISLQALYARAGDFVDLSPKARQLARNAMLSTRPEWSLDGKRLVRLATYFTTEGALT